MTELRQLTGLVTGTLATACAALAAPATPAPVAASPSGVAAAGLLQTSLSLLLVLAVILGLAWAARRLRLTPARRSGALAVLAEVALGPKDRVVLLKVGDAQALIGVGADGIRSLNLLATTIAIGEPVAEPSFATRLAEAIGRGSKP